MMYFRVSPVLNIEGAFDPLISHYKIQKRRWGIWFTIRGDMDRSEALMHLDSLQRGALLMQERDWERRKDAFERVVNKIEQRLRR